MNRKIVIGVLLAVVAIAAFVAFKYLQTPKEVILTETTIERPEIRFGFTYKIGANGYSLSEAPRDASSTDALLNGFVLRPVRLDETPVIDSEPEPVISMFVIEEPDLPVATSTGTTTEISDLDELKAKAEQYSNITGYKMMIGDPEVVRIDGVDVLHFTADGLYLHDTYFTSVFGNIYLIIGQYIDPNDKIHKDFEDLVTSITFG